MTYKYIKATLNKKAMRRMTHRFLTQTSKISYGLITSMTRASCHHDLGFP